MEGILHEPEVVGALVYGLAHVANQVLEERAENNVQNLDDLDVQEGSQDCLSVEIPEVHTTSQVFLSGGNIELREGLGGVLSGVDACVEVVSDVVHEEAFEFSFEPEDALLGLHVDVERAEYALPLGVDVLHNIERLLVDRDADPAEQLRLVQRRWELVRGCL